MTLLGIFGTLVAALLGAALGSFINVLVIRLYHGTTLWGRSQCPHCQSVLRPRHLVPIFSWIVLRGRCATCHRPIHIQYPLVELLMACLTVVTYLRYQSFMWGGDVSSFFFELFFIAVLLTLSVFDIRWQRLPVEAMILSLVVCAVWNVFRDGPSILSMLIGAAFGAAFLGAQVLISRGRWMGAGDPLLAMIIGVGIGWPLSGYAMYMTYVVGGLLMLLLLGIGIVKRGLRIPFGPMLAAGAILSLWIGPWLHAMVQIWWRFG